MESKTFCSCNNNVKREIEVLQISFLTTWLFEAHSDLKPCVVAQKNWFTNKSKILNNLLLNGVALITMNYD